MRVNLYAEELPDPNDPRATESVQTTTKSGRTFYGARLFLKSSDALHDTLDDDDRSAITIWGPRVQVAKLLRQMSDQVEAAGKLPGDEGGGMGRNQA